MSLNKRRHITIAGCVQGVGFRPFVYRLAQQHYLKGSISNTSSGVIIDVQGQEHALACFQTDLIATKPKGAVISEINVLEVDLHEVKRFEIKESQRQSDTALALLPDTAICSLCLQELFDPHNRRYRYPFIHCIACGPRFSLFFTMPFDRANTTMADFSMCQACQHEYEDSDNRRFYSQTNCCPACGPQLQLLNAHQDIIASKNDAVRATAQLLEEGKIVAMKNTGGYLLLVDAANESAVHRLRQLKRRKSKPFALLMPALESIYRAAHVCSIAEETLTSPTAPIVLIKKKEGIQEIAPSVACDSPYYGVMLPHNALQHLLLEAIHRPLVATSGNVSGSPLCITEKEAFTHLYSIADAFLIHNRCINHRLDDSIVHVIANKPVVIRRARGYIPYAILVPESVPVPETAALFAAGSHQKSSFAFLKKKLLYMSQHIGDLESAETCRAYDREVDKWERLLTMQPTKGAGDKHPGYYTSHYLQKSNKTTTNVQHHKAHVWAGMADNCLKPPFLGVAWDGTGWGEDETVWGGEAFTVSNEGIQHVASLYPFRLPGGEKAVREPLRAALGALYAMGREHIQHLQETFDSNIEIALRRNVNVPLCSSIGRLFDAVSAILDCCTISDFEGQAAMILEAQAHKAKQQLHYHLPLLQENDLLLLDWRPMVIQMLEDKNRGASVPEIAWAFHEALAQSVVELARIAKYKNVLLSGGVMQNKLLVEICVEKLQQAGFTPYLHRNIPPNDGGLAVGQLIGALYVSGITG